jgi:hypothetical protein
VLCRREVLIAWAVMGFSALSSGCAPRVVVSLPTGQGRPEPAAESRLAEVSKRCAAVRTWSAEIGVTGRVRDQTVRLKILGGTTSGGDLRLEGVAPFGSPLFLLVSSGDRASLLLPRESRLLKDASTAQVLDALIGLSLSAADVHALLTGCLGASGQAANGRAFDGGWLAVDVGDDRTAFLREVMGEWRLDAAKVGPMAIAYDAFSAAAPAEIRLASEGVDRRSAVRLLLRLTQVEENAALPPEAFVLDAPPGTRPLSVEELRERGLRLVGS